MVKRLRQARRQKKKKKKKEMPGTLHIISNGEGQMPETSASLSQHDEVDSTSRSDWLYLSGQEHVIRCRAVRFHFSFATSEIFEQKQIRTYLWALLIVQYGINFMRNQS